MSEYELNSAYWWFSNLAVWIPIIGLMVGGMCALAARQMKGEMAELIVAKETARQRRVAEQERQSQAAQPPAPAPAAVALAVLAGPVSVDYSLLLLEEM